MKLSQAIRKGAAQYPQCLGRLSCLDDHGQVQVCALGAAYVGATGNVPSDPEDGDWRELRRLFPDMRSEVDPAAIPGIVRSGIVDYNKHPLVEDVVWPLNDQAEWTREQIAEWLEGMGY